jgi:hypothetical protein
MALNVGKSQPVLLMIVPVYNLPPAPVRVGVHCRSTHLHAPSQRLALDARLVLHVNA